MEKKAKKLLEKYSGQLKEYDEKLSQNMQMQQAFRAQEVQFRKKIAEINGAVYALNELTNPEPEEVQPEKGDNDGKKKKKN